MNEPKFLGLESSDNLRLSGAKCIQMHYENKVYLYTFMEKEMAPTPVFLPRESHGQRGLTGCSRWGLKESDTTEQRTLYTFKGVIHLFPSTKTFQLKFSI